MNQAILLVDDERDIVEFVEVYLKNEGYQVFKFYNPIEALEWVKDTDQEISLAIMDVMMPEMDGFTLCRKLREKFLFPIIMLTAKVEDIDKISGLTMGADDYITKPFNPLELMARVKTQIRRYRSYNEGPSDREDRPKTYDIRGLSISADSHTCLLNGKEIELTPIEFKILWCLCENMDKVVSSEDLFEAVWQEKYLENNNTVMAHIARLREKLNEPARKPRFIKTVWGVGYKIES